MGIMVYSVLWVMQDFDHQQYYWLVIIGSRLRDPSFTFLHLRNRQTFKSPGTLRVQRTWQLDSWSWVYEGHGT